jgi:hypothetical protein
MNTFEKFVTIRNMLANRCGEIMIFNDKWNDYFCASRIKDFPTDVKEEANNGYLLFNLDPSDLTEEEMISLGFISRSKFDESPTYSIPLWLFPFLADGIKVIYPDGESTLIDKSDEYGYFSLYVHPKSV